MTLRVLITGSRGWKDSSRIETELIRVAAEAGADPADVVVVHGGAGGADRLAGAVAEMLGMQVEVHEADWQGWGKAAGYRRNEHMVSLGADKMLAFWDGNSGGTAHCMRVATQAGLDLKVIKEGR